MKIRKARAIELDKIEELFDNGRKFMRAHGNTNQWINGYPSRALLEEDIEFGRLFVAVDDGSDGAAGSAGSGSAAGSEKEDESEILAVFAYILGDDPTYQVIESGTWLNDKPYGTIHRLVSSGKVPKIAQFVFDWALDQCDNLRGDTHSDNYVMQSVAEEFGFKMCGIIHLENGDPRVAYHVTKELRQKVKETE